MQQFAKVRKNLREKKKKVEHSCLLSNRIPEICQVGFCNKRTWEVWVRVWKCLGEVQVYGGVPGEERATVENRQEPRVGVVRLRAQKLFEDLKELAEYDNCPSKDRPIFFNDDEVHSVQDKEHLENPSDEITASNPNQDKENPPQDSDIRQLIREEYCIEDLIESALNTKLLSINSKSQRLDKKKQEVKNVKEQPAGRYEHLSITPETESDEVTESSAKNLLPIPSECEVTSENKSECDMPAKDDSSPALTTFSNPIFNDNDDLDSSNDKSLPEEYVPAEEFKEFSGELAHINLVLPGIKEADVDFEEEIRLIENLLEEIDIISGTDELLPPGFENDDAEEEIDTTEDLHVENPTSNSANELSNNEATDSDNPLFPRPPPEPPDAEFDLKPDSGEVIDEPNEDEHFDPGGEINVPTKDKDDDYFSFIFVMRIFLPYLIHPEVSHLFLSAKSEDTIFGPGISF
nr:hypothetical protein [Tanacetum cinerariifolium]